MLEFNKLKFNWKVYFMKWSFEYILVRSHKILGKETPQGCSILNNLNPQGERARILFTFNHTFPHSRSCYIGLPFAINLQQTFRHFLHTVYSDVHLITHISPHINIGNHKIWTSIKSQVLHLIQILMKEIFCRTMTGGRWL